MDTNFTAPANLSEYSIGGSMKHNFENFVITMLSAKQQLDLVILFFFLKSRSVSAILKQKEKKNKGSQDCFLMHAIVAMSCQCV